jgi:hypothetical protein
MSSNHAAAGGLVRPTVRWAEVVQQKAGGSTGWMASERRDPRPPGFLCDPNPPLPVGTLTHRQTAVETGVSRRQTSTRAIRATASSISSTETVSGGSSLIVSGPVALTTSRCSSSRRLAVAGPSST